MSSANILFYSNRCEPSKYLISMMNTENLLRFFYQICIDTMQNIPEHITMTPTIIIKGVPTPYAGKDAFSWLSRVKQWKNSVMIKRMNDEKQQYLKSINSNLLPESDSSILGFSPLEMSGMSDIFTYFSRNIDNERDDALPKTYFVCDNMGKEVIITPPLEGGSYRVSRDSKCKMSEMQQKKLLHELKSDRENYDRQMKDNLDKFINQKR